MGNTTSKATTSPKEREVRQLLLELTNKLENLELWEERQTRWKLTEQAIQQNFAQAKDLITLDIGGTTFRTTKHTLTSVKDTYFYVLLASGKLPNEEGVYFIDRNPKHFGRILDYLRNGKLFIADLTEEYQHRLLEDLDFYRIPRPPPSAKWSNEGSESISICHNGFLARKMSGVHKATLGNRPVRLTNLPCVFTVTFRNMCTLQGNVYVGLMAKSRFRTNPELREDDVGYILNLSSGNVVDNHSKKKIWKGVEQFSTSTPKGYVPIATGSLFLFWISRSVTGVPQEGDKIQVVHDRKNKTISFGINGEPMQEAFKTVDQELYPYAIFFDKGAVLLVDSECY